MAKIGLSEGFTIIPEGVHAFQITEVNYKEDFGNMEVVMQTASGQKHTERFSLLDKNGNPNQGALNAFSYFAKTALNDYDLTEIDHEDLIGHFIRCGVEHEAVPSKRNPNRTVTFIRLGDKEPCDGFDDAPGTAHAPKNTASAVSASGQHFDLDSLLG